MNRLFQTLLPVLVYWAQRFWILKEFSWKWTDEDQALLAYGVREIQSGHFHEPSFYGQTYGNWLESFFAALITPQTLSPHYTLPWITQLSFWAPFFVLALTHRRLRVWILWIPCLLSFRADLLYSMPRAWIPGISLCFLSWGTSEYLSASRPKVSAWILGAGATLGVSLNSAAGLLALPLLLERVLERKQVRELSYGVAIGLLHPIAVSRFYSLHPEWPIHPAPTWEWSFQNWIRGLQEPEPFLSAFGGLILGVALLVVARVFFSARSPTPIPKAFISSSVVAGLIIVASLSLNKVWDGSWSVFFPYERAFLAIPYLSVWALIRLAPSLATLPFTLRWAPPALLAIKLLLLQSAVEIEFGQRLHQGVVAPRELISLLPTCKRIQSAALDARAQLVSFLDDRTLAYFCGTQWHGQLQTQYSAYERRSWIRLSHPLQQTVLKVSGSGDRLEVLVPQSKGTSF